MRHWHVIVAISLLLAPAAISYFNHTIFGIDKYIRVESVNSAARYIEISHMGLNKFHYVKTAIETKEAIKVPKSDKTTDEFINMLVKGNTSVFKVGNKFYRLVVIYD